MENETEQPSDRDAAAALAALQADRENLAANTTVPAALLAAYGGVGAWYVASSATTTPGAGYEAPGSYWLGIVAVLLITYLVQRETGIKFKEAGAGAFGYAAAILVLCLGLYSASLAVISLGARWAVVVTSLVAFAGTWWLAGLAYRSALSRLSRG